MSKTARLIQLQVKHYGLLETQARRSVHRSCERRWWRFNRRVWWAIHRIPGVDL